MATLDKPSLIVRQIDKKCDKYTDDYSSEVMSRIVVTSPGAVTMPALAALAKGLDTPFAALAKAIYRAPMVLIEGISTTDATDLLEACRRLGLEVEAQSRAVALDVDLQRYDLAAWVEDPAAIPATVEAVSLILGVSQERAYQMLATPPGTFIGDISSAAVSALSARFPAGVRISCTPTGQGPFDIFVSAQAPHTPEIARLCGADRGVIAIGADLSQAQTLHSRLPIGSTRLIARRLIRYDVVLRTGSALGPDAVLWLRSHFGVSEAQVSLIPAHTPIALSEGLDGDEAHELVLAGQAVGLDIVTEPAGFHRCSVSVLSARDRSTMAEVLRRSHLAVPASLPACVVDDFSDLDARWLAYQLRSVGATVSFGGP